MRASPRWQPRWIFLVMFVLLALIPLDSRYGDLPRRLGSASERKNEVTLARGTAPAQTAGKTQPWSLVSYIDDDGSHCLSLDQGGNVSSQCGPVWSLDRYLPRLYVDPSFKFSREVTFGYGHVAPNVATIRIEPRGRNPIATPANRIPRIGYRYFVIKILPPLKEAPVVVALDARGRVLTRITRSGRTGAIPSPRP